MCRLAIEATAFSDEFCLLYSFTLSSNPAILGLGLTLSHGMDKCWSMQVNTGSRICATLEMILSLFIFQSSTQDVGLSCLE